MADLVSFVNKDGMVSSKLVAEKFGKQHQHVLRELRDLISKIPKEFSDVHFWTAPVQKGFKESQEYTMTRDGFSLLAMGFTGKAALAWKVRFLEAFNQMEQTVLAEIPTLKATIARMQSERLVLTPERKPHHLTDTSLVPVYQIGMFGEEIVEYRRVPRSDERFSELSRIEGKMAHFSSCIEGMANALRELSRQAAIHRRK